MTRQEKLVKLAEGLMDFGSELFNKKGPDEIQPMFVGEDEKGEKTALMTPFSSDEEKQMIARMVHEFFVEKQILRYAFLSEGWMRVATPEENKNPKKIDPKVSEHEDRREALIVVANDGITDVYMCRYILRPEHGKPCLSPVESSVHERKGEDGGLFGNLLTEVV